MPFKNENSLCKMSIFVRKHDNPSRQYMLHTYITNIEAGDIPQLVSIINAEILVQLKEALGGHYSRYFNNDELFHYNGSLKRVEKRT